MVVGRTDHLPGGAAPNWVSPKQGSGPMARHAVTASVRIGPCGGKRRLKRCLTSALANNNTILL